VGAASAQAIYFDINKQYGGTMKVPGLMVISLALMFLGSHCNADISQFTVVAATNDWKPWYYSQDGEIKGSVFEISKKIFKRANVKVEHHVWPWTRVYDRGLREKNFLIISLGRTFERESLFHWVGPITKGLDIYFFKLKSNSTRIKNFEDAKKYRTAAIKETYFYDFLLRNKFKDKIFPVIKPEQLLDLALRGRVQYFLLSEDRMLTIAKQNQIDPNKFEKSLYAFSVVDHMAFSKMTSIELVEKVKAAYQELKNEGEIVLN